MRHALAAFAVVLSTLLVPIGITATWLSLRVDNTAGYVDTVEPLAADPELRNALAKEVAAAAVATLEGNVPLGLLPGGDRRHRAGVDEGHRPERRLPGVLATANANAHREFLAIVHEREEDVVADGYVVLDMRPLLDDVLADFAAEFGMPASMAAVGPAPGPVVAESSLEQARGGYSCWTRSPCGSRCCGPR